MSVAAARKALLVVIDLQEIFADPQSGWYSPGFSSILEPVDALVAAYEPNVIFTRFVAPPVPLGAWRAYYERYPFALIAPGDPGYALVERYAAHRGDSLETTTFSKWVPGLIERCAPETTLVLAGVTTDCCVLATALQAADAGLAVRVVREACAGANDESYAQALALMELFSPLVEVVDLDAALELAAGSELAQ